MTTRKRKQPGFSVVEAVIVLAVLALILAAVIPQIQRRRAAAATQELPEAVSKGDFQRVAALIERGADVNTVRPVMPRGTDLGFANPHSMLSLAIRLRHGDVARLLLRNGADPNGDQPDNFRQPLFWAAYTLDANIFDALIAAGADLEFELNGGTAYEHAEGPYNNAADFLRERGAKTN